MSLSVILLMLLTVLSGHVLACPVGPPCTCRNQTNPYTRKPEYVADCAGLGMTSVPSFIGEETVDKLLLAGNLIEKLFYGSFLNVKPKSIDLTSNGLQMIASGSFKGLEHCLEELLLGTNNIVLPLPGIRNLTSLKLLNLDFNPSMDTIPSNSFSGLISLEKLILTGSYIESFEEGAFDGLPALTSLDFAGSMLSEVPTVLSVLSSLKYLNFDANQISEIKAFAFNGLFSLKELQLSRNSFSSAGSIDVNAFADLENLETLGFFHTMLGSVPLHVLAPLVNLKKLDLSYNNLSRIEEGTFSEMSLTQLDISGNHIHFEPGMFEGIENSLNYILIRRNGLSALPVSALSSIQTLQWIDSASSNFTKDLPPNFASGLSTLNRISLMWMNLTSVKENTFEGVAEPFHLDIFSNQIKSLNFIMDPCKYIYVDISENPIHCDCHVYNLTQADTTYFQGTCFSPTSYKGLDLRGDEFQRKAKEDCSHYPITGPIKCPWS